MNHRFRLPAFYLTGALVLLGRVALAQDAAAPTPARHVVIISIDGARPDNLLRADMPNVRGLMKRGAFSFWAVTTPLAVTLPSHTSMLTGVTVERHGVDWNDDEHNGVLYPKAVTIFALAHHARLSTALASGKSKFVVLAEGKTVDYLSVPEAGQTKSDRHVGEAAARMIAQHRPAVLFVHLGDDDAVGHAIGWGTPEQITALEAADQAVGVVVKALADAKLTDETLVILSADHGGAGRRHGGPDPRSQFIPWICAGPGTRKNYDLTRFEELQIRTEDTFATACFALRLSVSPGNDGRPIDGKPVLQAFEQSELLAPAVAAATTAPTTAPTTKP